MKTDTPETDSKSLGFNYVHVDFARRLERERNRATRFFWCMTWAACWGLGLVVGLLLTGCTTRETPDERRWREIREAGEKTTYGGETYEFNGRAWRKVK